MNEFDTIAAISTAVSESGIALIRVSGPDAIRIVDKIFRPADRKLKLQEAASHTIHYGYIEDNGEVIDEVLVSVFRQPRSFTAENTAEINCHGGVCAVRKVLETVLHAGARPAEPGEFTKRAFLNGRIDLTKAEAVMDVIQAKNGYALKSSVSQLRGSLYEAVSALRGEILYETARVESALDDPENYSLEGYAQQLQQKNSEWLEKLSRLISSADNGRLIQEGIATAIIGKPNVGKSSLLNRLMGEDRAIVTDIAGTTRDILRETLQLGDITLVLTDTAGIRTTQDQVEKIGVDRAISSAEGADLVLFVIDSSSALEPEDYTILEMLKKLDKKTIVLLNKNDLENVVEEKEILELMQGSDREPDVHVLSVSTLDGNGMDSLEKLIRDLFYHGEISFNDEIIITNVRQKQKLEEAVRYLEKVEESIRLQLPEDFYTIDLSGAFTALGEITGESVREDLIHEIFSRFCMGK